MTIPENNICAPTLSVITIVYNNAADIERTMRSVLTQTYPRIEYILVDGGSTDGTVEIIKQYADRIDKWISEPDRGIYHAMNKGLGMASGDYVLFMNSGDELYAPDTVEQVFKSAVDADIYYGETEMYNKKWESLGRRRHQAPKTFSWKGFRFGMCISHQAIYVKRRIAEPYDERYQLSADIDWIIRCAKKARVIIPVNQYVAKYLVGGISKKRHRQSLKERFAIFSKHYGVIPNLINHFAIAFKWLVYYLKHGKTND